jgi:hypothetical protein
MPGDQIERFRLLEEQLWRGGPRIRNQILSNEYREFCRFGDIYDRDHIINASSHDVVATFPFENFNVESLSDDVVLVTYENTVTSAKVTERARRSSVWVRSDGEWRLRFQQATTLPETESGQ